jgi:2-oxo-3-hexenedioate decarboxylase
MNASDIRSVAAQALAALDNAQQVEPFSARFPDLDMAAAYAVSAAIHRMRLSRGEKPVGRKLGFTNRALWPQYHVHEPVWGYMYDSTLRMPNDAPVPLTRFCEPQIEPEVALTLARAPAPAPDMDEAALLACGGAVTHGFEIVQSIYTGWRFKAADTVIAFGMHGLYLPGPPLAATGQNRGTLLAALTDCRVTLCCDGRVIEEGFGRNALGGPLTALRHLVRLLARDPQHPPLAPGEIVTTGTLTRAFPVRAGESWTSTFSGIALPGLALRFG